eukprot:COSAG02_NODE_2428_length_8885_cov_11.257796_8_plen_86_part_00
MIYRPHGLQQSVWLRISNAQVMQHVQQPEPADVQNDVMHELLSGIQTVPQSGPGSPVVRQNVNGQSDISRFPGTLPGSPVQYPLS